VIAPPWLLALALVVGFLVLAPARRLRTAGLGRGAVGSYALILWALAMVVAIRPGATRLLIPVLLIAYLIPFMVSTEALSRVLRREVERSPPLKNVTPQDPPSDRD
jgi:hypothetical protein